MSNEVKKAPIEQKELPSVKELADRLGVHVYTEVKQMKLKKLLLSKKSCPLLKSLQIVWVYMCTLKLNKSLLRKMVHRLVCLWLVCLYVMSLFRLFYLLMS